MKTNHNKYIYIYIIIVKKSVILELLNKGQKPSPTVQEPRDTNQ